MFDTGFVLPTIAENITASGTAWTNVDNIKVEGDGSFARSILSLNGLIDIADQLVRFSISGTPQGDNKASATAWGEVSAPPDGNTVTYGSSTDLWGLTLTPAIVNDATFAINLRAHEPASTGISQVLRGRGFGFSVPSDAIITGLEVQINKLKVEISGRNVAEVFWMKVKVHYRRRKQLFLQFLDM